MKVRKADNSMILKCDWESAKFYCMMLDHKRQKDWRLPTLWELKFLIIRNQVSLGTYWTCEQMSSTGRIYAITVEMSMWDEQVTYHASLALAQDSYLVLPIRTFIPNQYKKKK